MVAWLADKVFRLPGDRETREAHQIIRQQNNDEAADETNRQYEEEVYCNDERGNALQNLAWKVKHASFSRNLGLRLTTSSSATRGAGADCAGGWKGGGGLKHRP